MPTHTSGRGWGEAREAKSSRQAPPFLSSARSGKAVCSSAFAWLSGRAIAMLWLSSGHAWGLLQLVDDRPVDMILRYQLHIGRAEFEIEVHRLLENRIDAPFL